jgi:adenosine deaminase
MELFCRAVPKVELHIHLDGCFDPEELWHYLEKNPELLHCFPIEKKLPWEKPDAAPAEIRGSVSNCNSSLDYRRLCTCRRRYRKLRHANERQRSMRKAKGSLEDMLLCFEFFTPLVYDNFGLLEHLACDFVRRQYEQNVVYTEVRYSPHLLSEDPRLAHKAITKGLRRGCQMFPECIVNQLLCGINFCPQWSSDVVDMAIEFRQDFPCAVVGIDVAAGEDHFAPDSPFHQGHLDMCRKAMEHCVPITLHAGEVPESKHNVPKAILKYGAKRIGHGYSTSDDNETLALVKSRNIHFEACPTSSVVSFIGGAMYVFITFLFSLTVLQYRWCHLQETGGWIKTDWKDHPACVLRSNGVKVSLSSDDPAVFNTSLTWQWRIAMKKMGWKESDVLEILDDSIEASFAPESQKEKIRQELQKRLSQRECFTKKLNLVFRDRVHYD